MNCFNMCCSDVSLLRCALPHNAKIVIAISTKAFALIVNSNREHSTSCPIDVP